MGIATFHGPHLLILDEPTNHLDIDSRAALMEAINDYQGAIILISHDRFLLEACADRLWLVSHGTVKPFDDDLDAYRKFVLDGTPANERPTRSDHAVKARQAEEKREVAKPKVALAPMRRRIEVLDQRMAKLSELMGKVDKVLADPQAFQRDPGRAAQLAAQRRELERGLAAAEEEWLALSAEYEIASAG
jgi:ATP-binding cassette subfamily F protein 3